MNHITDHKLPKRLGAMLLALAMLFTLMPAIAPTALALGMGGVFYTDDGIQFTADHTGLDEASALMYTVLTESGNTGTVSIGAYPAYTSGVRAFTGNAAGNSLTIPETVTYDGVTYTVTEVAEDGFRRCDNMTGTLTIPQTLLVIGRQAFQPLNAANMGIFAIVYEGTPTLTTIGMGAFWNCTNLSGELYIPVSVTTIGVSAFDFISSSYRNIEAVRCEATDLTDYAAEAFDGVTDLPLICPVGYESAYQSKFSWTGPINGALSVTTLSIGDEFVIGTAQSNRLTYTVLTVDDSGHTATLSIKATNRRQFTGNAANNALVIPETVACDVSGTPYTLTVTDIPFSDNYGAFENSQIHSVTIPKSIVVMGADTPGISFYQCLSLTTITVDDNNPNYSSIDGALYDKAGTTLYTVPMGKSGAFAIPDGVTDFAVDPFYGCSGLTQISIPASLISISRNPFSYCTALTTITVDNGNTGLKVVDGVLYTYDGTTLICYPAPKSGTAFTVPDDVTTIVAAAFHNNALLTRVTVPAGVATIGNQAFQLCTALETVLLYRESNLSSYNVNAFLGLSSLNIYVPAAAYSSYNTLYSGNGTVHAGMPQTVSFASGSAAASGAVSKTYGDADFTFAATSDGPGEVTYASDDPSVATVDANGKVTIVKAGTAEITATAAASGLYVEATVSYTLTVGKATPGYTTPSGLTATYGQTLGDVSLPTGFTWNDSTASVGAVGDRTHTATFTPTDMVNYNTVTDVPVTITVGKAQPTVTFPTNLTAGYGDTLASVDPNSGDGTGEGIFSWTAGGTTAVGAVGPQSHNMTFTPTESANYNTVTQAVTVTVSAKSISGATVSISGTYTYTGNAITPAAANVSVTVGGKTLTYGTDYTFAVTVGGTDAGSATVTVTGQGNYTGTETQTFTIGKKTPAASDLIYNLNLGHIYTGSAQGIATPALLSPRTGMGTITVKYDGSTTSPTDAGTYAVTVDIAEGGNYAGINGLSLGTYTIGKAAAPSINWPAASPITYGAALSTSALTGGSTEYGSFAWTYGSDIPEVQVISHHVTFTPSVATVKNYEPITTTTKAVAITVNKATTTGVNQTYEVVKNLAQDYSFDLTTLLPGVEGLTGVAYSPVITTNADGVLDASLSYTSGNTLTLPVQSVADAGKTATVTVTISSDNYANFDAIITVNTIDKIPVTISGATMTGGAYNGNAYAYTGTPVIKKNTDQSVVSGITLEVLYESTDGGNYSSASAPTNAGDYKLTLSVPSGDATYSGTVSYTFTISKKEVKVIADNLTVKQGATLPTATVRYDGFVGTDSKDNALSTQAVAQLNVADSSTVGGSTIDFATQAVLNGTVGENYTLTHQNGTLTVEALSAACDVLTVTSPSGATINGTNIMATVSNSTSSLTVSISVSAGATWALYSDAACTTPITGAWALSVGANTAYIKVTAEDGVATKLYTIAVTRQSGGSTGGNTGNTGGSVSTPSSSDITAPTTESGWADAAIQVNKLSDSAEVTIDMTKTATVSGDFLEAVAGKDVDIIFDLGGGMTWTVNGTDIPEGMELSSLNLTVSVGTDYISAEVRNIEGSISEVQIRLAHDGEFGFKMVLSVALDKENAGYFANLYYYNEETGALEFQSAVEIASDGAVEFVFTHASDYLVVVAETSLAPAVWENPFSDVKADNWFYEAVQYARENGIMNGTSETTFDPYVNLSRAMMVQILWNLEGNPTAASADFTDVASGAWYANAVAWAAECKIVDGYGDGNFGPADSINREQMAVMLYRYCEYKGMELPSARTGDFVDSGSISTWAVEAVKSMYEAEILNGKGSNTFDPKGTATRAEVAQMMKNFMEAVK